MLNPPDPPPTSDEQVSCVTCNLPDRPGNCVQCDGCSCWWHFTCAGVDSSVRERGWICTKCEAAASVSGKSSKTNKTASSVACDLERLKQEQEIERQQADLMLQLKFLDQQKKLLDNARAAEETRSKKSQVSRRSRDLRVQEWVEKSRDGSEEGAVGENPAPAASPIRQQTPPDTRDQEEAPVNSEVAELRAKLDLCMQRMDEAFRQRPANPVPQVPQSSVPQLERTTCDDQRNTGAIPKTYPIPDEAGKRQASFYAPNKSQPDSYDISPPITNQNNHPFSQFVPPPNTNSRSNVYSPFPDVNKFLFHRQASPLQNPPLVPPANSQLGPTSQQLVARQSLARDLPTFTGDPAEWPIFISSYNYTTGACGYSNGENMIRLQRCLKGSALESMRSRLVIPTTVSSRHCKCATVARNI